MVIPLILIRAKRFWAWLSKARPFWTWLLVALFIIWLSWVFPNHWIKREAVDRIKWCGMLFQLAGLVTVFRGLDESRSIFAKGRLWTPLLEWLKEFRSAFRKGSAMSAAASFSGVAAMSAAGTVRVAVSETLEDRLRRLEEQFEKIEAEMTRKINELSEQTKQLIKDEVGARAAGDNSIKQTMENAIIGGINLEVGGAAFLFLGILLTSIPEDVERFLHLICKHCF
jgi:hypothetical protein